MHRSAMPAHALANCDRAATRVQREFPPQLPARARGEALREAAMNLAVRTVCATL